MDDGCWLTSSLESCHPSGCADKDVEPLGKSQCRVYRWNLRDEQKEDGTDATPYIRPLVSGRRPLSHYRFVFGILVDQNDDRTWDTRFRNHSTDRRWNPKNSLLIGIETLTKFSRRHKELTTLRLRNVLHFRKVSRGDFTGHWR